MANFPHELFESIEPLCENCVIKTIAGKGIHIRMVNGYTVSVQWGPFNYCAGHPLDGNPDFSWQSDLAEVAVFDSKNTWVTREFADCDDDVAGYCSIEKVLAIISSVLEKE